MVSHRISTIRHADHILVIDNGVVIEEGTHEYLVTLGGLYADMNTQQEHEAQAV